PSHCGGGGPAVSARRQKGSGDQIPPLGPLSPRKADPRPSQSLDQPPPRDADALDRHLWRQWHGQDYDHGAIPRRQPARFRSSLGQGANSGAGDGNGGQARRAQILRGTSRVAWGASEPPRRYRADGAGRASTLERRRPPSARHIDEVHNILAGSHRDQRVVLNTLRFLSNRLQISLVCFGVMDAREAISGDVQLARRFEEFSINRWAANEQFETLVSSILRNTPLRKSTVLTPKSLRRILQVTEGITANIFHMINGLAADAAQSGQERITDEGIESWRPLSDRGAAFA